MRNYKEIILKKLGKVSKKTEIKMKNLWEKILVLKI